MDIVTSVGVIDKAVGVLRVVARGPCTLAELQAGAQLPRATAHRLAAALVEHGLLRRDAAGRYDLGADLAGLGRVAAARFPLAALARPPLERLRAATGETVQLFVPEGPHRRCVLALQSPHALQWVVPEGALLPLEQGSAGRVLLGETSADGWVATVAEREPGVASVSAPVVTADGHVVAAVSVAGPIERLSSTPGDRFGAAVVDSAAAVTTALRTA
ncbi:MAG TPA: IclR family transcriptional regulator [Ilumatobacter sp.]|nr:IclR family transcriptional regulator [Ilumatobacter sp.]